MTFLSGAFLAGLAAIAAPVIIHLIHRQRYPDRAFPTLRFFDKTVKHNVLQRRLIDRILLALRVLALALLALGLSRPFWHSAIGEPRMSLVIVLDNSPSMSRPHDGKPLLDQARARVARVLDQLGPADRVEIVLTSGGAPSPALRKEVAAQLALHAGEPTALIVGGEHGAENSVPGMTTDASQLGASLARVPDQTPVTLASFDGGRENQFGYDHARLRTLLDSVKVSSLPGNMHAALASAAEMLSRSGDGDRKILVISDLQAADWQGEANYKLAGLDVKVVTLEPDTAIGPNLGIEAGVVSHAFAGLGQTVTGTFTVRNYGAQPSPQAMLRVVAGDHAVPIEIKVPPIAPRSAMLVTVPIRAAGRDHMLGVATIVSATDPFAYDNTWHFQMGVRPPVTALCVNGAAGASGADKSTFFVMNALATRGGGAAASADARECETDEIKKQKLFEYAVVVLADAPALDADARQKLRQFVADGGGLLVFANPSAAPDEYNAWDFLPARVTGQKKKTFLYVRSIAERATAVAEVRRRAGSTIHGLSTDESVALEPAEASTVLARFSDGSPAMVEGRIGKGRVIEIATSCHVSKSDWPLQPAFVLLVRELVQYLGNNGNAGAIAPQRTVGEGAAMTIAAERIAGTPELFRLASPGADTAYVALPWHRQNNRLVMPDATEPGQYLLAVRPDSVTGLPTDPGLGADSTPVSVNHDPRESDLTPATVESITKALPGATVAFETPGADSVANLRSGRDLWRFLVLGALVFILVEGVMAWRWASESS